jgi:hypothetical protein
VRLAGEIDWEFLEQRFAAVCEAGPGQPPLPARLIAGLFILKHTHSLSDEVLCARWLENPYYQYFCGEQAFRHELPFDRSSMTRWRQRLAGSNLACLHPGARSIHPGRREPLKNSQSGFFTGDYRQTRFSVITILCGWSSYLLLLWCSTSTAILTGCQPPPRGVQRWAS